MSSFPNDLKYTILHSKKEEQHGKKEAREKKGFRCLHWQNVCWHPYVLTLLLLMSVWHFVLYKLHLDGRNGAPIAISAIYVS